MHSAVYRGRRGPRKTVFYSVSNVIVIRLVGLVCLVAASVSGAASAGGRQGSGVQALLERVYPDRRYFADPARALSARDDVPEIQAKSGAFELRKGSAPRIRGVASRLLVQLQGPLTEAWRARLDALGVILHDYVPSNAWLATVPATALAELRGLPFVYALGEVYPVDKLPAGVVAGDFSARSFNGDGTLSLEVYFHPDVTLSSALAALADVGAATTLPTFLAGQRLTAVVPVDRLALLLGRDEVRWLEDREPPKITSNVDAAALSRTPSLWASPLSLTGEGVIMGIWDAGAVEVGHGDFGQRVAVVETGAASGHATHVAGTMMGSGSGNASARGMATAARLLSHDYYGDVVGEQQAARNERQMVLSNHSWTYASGWQYDRYGDGRWVWYGGNDSVEEPDFGAYTANTANWDRLVHDLDLIVVKSAGNDRNDAGAGSAAHYHIGDDETLHSDYHAPDGDYDSIGQIAVAKNVITVGAVDEAAGMTVYSGWGPADDGRVKPDIVANGSTVYSTYGRDGYAYLSGTSQSAPVVSGALGLLIELYRRVAGSDPGADTIKALLAHSARDLGQPGPDYRYGWGLLDVAAAAGIVEGNEGRIDFGDVAHGQMISYPLDVAADTDRLKVTIAWTDPAASPLAASALVNDLDLTLVSPDGRTAYPFSLSGITHPQAAAAYHGPNRVDNVEQVVVESPMAGTWTVNVTAHAVQGRQAFAMISDDSRSAAASARALLSINDGAAQVSSRDVVVTLAGSSDDGITGYHIAENPSAPGEADFVGVEMTPDYEIQVPFELSGDDGVKTVYGWVRDGQGNVGTAAFDTVNLVSRASGGGGGGMLDIITVVVLVSVWRLAKQRTR